jgi:hypothetical protein
MQNLDFVIQIYNQLERDFIFHNYWSYDFPVTCLKIIYLKQISIRC